MATDYTTSLKNAAASVAKYIDDAATMEVITKFVEIDSSAAPDFDSARPVARTIIKLDADSETVIPMRKGASGALEVDSALFEIHQANVATAIDYRASLLDAMLSPILGREKASS
jgi:hypothetical protein